MSFIGNGRYKVAFKGKNKGLAEATYGYVTWGNTTCNGRKAFINPSLRKEKGISTRHYHEGGEWGDKERWSLPAFRGSGLLGFPQEGVICIDSLSRVIGTPRGLGQGS